MSIVIEDDGYMDIELKVGTESKLVTLDVVGFIDDWGAFAKQHEGNPELSKLVKSWLIEQYGFPPGMSSQAVDKILNAVVKQYNLLKKKDTPESENLPGSPDSTPEPIHSS